MEAKFEKATVGERLSNFFLSYRKILITVVSVILAFVICYGIAVAVISKTSKSGLEDIDSIAYIMTKDSVDLSEEELENRRKTALVSLEKYNKKSGVVGVRANMLTAEIKYSQKDYDSAASFWISAATKGKKSYTAPLCYFNAASALENAGKLDEAEKNYEKTVSYKDFDQIAHAKFNLGRIKETNGDTEGALKVYSELFDSVPSDSWAKLAKSRMLALQISNKESSSN